VVVEGFVVVDEDADGVVLALGLVGLVAAPLVIVFSNWLAEQVNLTVAPVL
jgi:hypothetical protein